MVAYGPFLQAPQPACEGSYGRIRSLPYGAAASLGGLVWSHMVPSLWSSDQPVRAHVVAYGPFPYSAVASL